MGGYEVFNVTYPSTRDDIGEHARSLAHIIDNLDGIEEVNFVAHSMGNIVIRHYLGDLQKQEAEIIIKHSIAPDSLQGNAAEISPLCHAGPAKSRGAVGHGLWR